MLVPDFTLNLHPDDKPCVIVYFPLFTHGFAGENVSFFGLFAKVVAIPPNVRLKLFRSKFAKNSRNRQFSRIATQLRHLCSNISSSHTFIKENHQTWKVLNQTKFSGLEGFKYIFIGRRILEYYYHTKLQKYIYKNTTTNIMFHRKYLWSL